MSVTMGVYGKEDTSASVYGQDQSHIIFSVNGAGNDAQQHMMISLINKDDKVFESKVDHMDFGVKQISKAYYIPLDQVYKEVPNGGVLTLQVLVLPSLPKTNNTG